MKNILLLLFGLVFLIPLRMHSQTGHLEYNKIPSIYYIDKIEIAYKEADVNLIDFYSTWENNGIFNDIRLIELKRKLEEDVVAFISKQWLYVLSYEPNKNVSHSDSDYKNELQRKVFLYKKFVGDSKTHPWSKANYNPIFIYNNPNNVSDAFTFSININGSTIKKLIKENYNERIVKTNNDNIIFILCDIESSFNGHTSYTKRLLILKSAKANDGSLYYDYDIPAYIRLYHYPKKFKREDSDEIEFSKKSFTIKTIDNNGKEQKIMMESKIEKTKDGFLETNIAYDGDYGSCSFKESTNYIK
jgi:hypothetical protein